MNDSHIDEPEDGQIPDDTSTPIQPTPPTTTLDIYSDGEDPIREEGGLIVDASRPSDLLLIQQEIMVDAVMDRVGDYVPKPAVPAAVVPASADDSSDSSSDDESSVSDFQFSDSEHEDGEGAGTKLSW
ncbi:hypothetical protein HDU98_002393 [Podochytrium sp. JEL0797]|nr:hypothetical protein HDU98_002393 [Podochytrium sp. JEL0797]